MHKLRKGVKNNFCSEAPEKKRKSAYLPEPIWSAIEQKADEENISRNKALERILQSYFSEGETCGNE